MNYIIPQEYRVQSREDYMANFWNEVEIHNGFSDGKSDARNGFAPRDSGVHSAAYHDAYAAGYDKGHDDFVCS